MNYKELAGIYTISQFSDLCDPSILYTGAPAFYSRPKNCLSWLWILFGSSQVPPGKF